MKLNFEQLKKHYNEFNKLEDLGDYQYKLKLREKDTSKHFILEPMNMEQQIKFYGVVKSNDALVSFIMNDAKGSTEEIVKAVQKEIIGHFFKHVDTVVKLLSITYNIEFKKADLIKYNQFEIIDLMIGAFKVNAGFFEEALAMGMKWLVQILVKFLPLKDLIK